MADAAAAYQADPYQQEEEVKVMPKKKSSKKKKGVKNFGICTQDASHEATLLKKLIAVQPSWRETDKTQATLRWMHPEIQKQEVLEWISSGAKKMCNRYPNIGILGHKDVFANNMKFSQEVDPERFDFIPSTFRLSEQRDMARFNEYK